MTKILNISSFGPIKDATVELKEINIFIGEQSVGKSTLAKLITILTDHISLSSIILSGHDAWNNLLNAYNLDLYAKDQYEIQYTWHVDNIHLKLHITDNALSYEFHKNDVIIDDPQDAAKEVIRVKPIYHDDKLWPLVEKAAASQKKEDFSSVIEFITNSLYVPAERVIYSVINKLWPALYIVKAGIPNNLVKFMAELQNAKATYPEFDVPLLDIKYKYEDSDDYFIINANKKKYPLSIASSGIQSTLPLLLVLHYAVNNREFSSFVIEEPECNLFPDKQIELLKHIISIVSNKNRTLTITTHSPYLLSAINNLLYSGNLQKEYGDAILDKLPETSINDFRLTSEKCSVYSIGEQINSNGIYCKSILDSDTGMIDFNALDLVSEKLGEEFNKMEDAYIEILNLDI